MQLTCPGKTVSYDSLRPPAAGRLTSAGNNTQLVKSMCVRCVCEKHSGEYAFVLIKHATIKTKLSAWMIPMNVSH